MLGVNTIKRLSKKGKLKLQSKLNNVSLRVRSRKVKKIIFLAMMSIIVTSACYTYPPSRRFICSIIIYFLHLVSSIIKYTYIIYKTVKKKHYGSSFFTFNFSSYRWFSFSSFKYGIILLYVSVDDIE
jgi:hypothetical protein